MFSASPILTAIMKLLFRSQNIVSAGLIVFSFCYAHTSSAQALSSDTSSYSVAVQNAINSYHTSLFPEPNLYNGSEYVDYAYTINEGIPFFISPDFVTGTVTYNNILYNNVPLMYDLVKEEVVIRDAYGRNKITLHNERISDFTLLNHHFVKLTADTLNSSVIRTGFYDLLYNGRTGVYKKQVKKILESITISQGLRRTIDEQVAYFIRKDNKFYEVSGKKSVLRILKDKKKNIQQFIKKNRLNLRKQKDYSLTEIAAYYDELTNR